VCVCCRRVRAEILESAGFERARKRRKIWGGGRGERKKEACVRAGNFIFREESVGAKLDFTTLEAVASDMWQCGVIQ
jgi:hypothetical protein